MITKKEIKHRCSEILSSNRGKQILGDDYQFLLSVFSHHPEQGWYLERGGDAQPEIWSKRNSEHDYKSDSFVVAYPNGFESSFSFRKCVANIPNQERSMVSNED